MMSNAAKRMTVAMTSLLLVIATFAQQPTYPDRQAIKQIIDRSGNDPIAGIWQMGGDGATFAVVPASQSTTNFDIIIIDSEDMSIIPGATIGHVKATGKTGTYDAEFYNKIAGIKRSKKFVMTLNTDGQLIISPYKQGRKVSLWRWIPYFFRVTVSSGDTRPNGIDAANRLYPSTLPVGPVML